MIPENFNNGQKIHPSASNFIYLLNTMGDNNMYIKDNIEKIHPMINSGYYNADIYNLCIDRK